MRFTERRLTRLGEADSLEREFRNVQNVVERARRNQWFGGDVLAPEFAPVLSAIVAPRRLRYAALFAGNGGSGARRGTAWRDAPDQG